MSSPFTTAANVMWIRFSSDSTTGQSSTLGFTARIESADPICGSHLTLNATSSTQVIIMEKYCIFYVCKLFICKYAHLKFMQAFLTLIFRYYKVLDILEIIHLTLVVNGL